jgi:type VI protein secretion system component VasF
MLSINGMACHEAGCPNSGKKWMPERGEWVRLQPVGDKMPQEGEEAWPTLLDAAKAGLLLLQSIQQQTEHADAMPWPEIDNLEQAIRKVEDSQ